MIAASFDVGISTGFVIAKIEKGEIPLILYTGTIDNRRIGIETFVYQNAVIPLDNLRPTTFIVEWPLSDSFSSLAKQTQKAMKMWQNVLNRYPEIPNLRAHFAVRPAEWKIKPVLSIDVYMHQPVPLISDTKYAHRPTRHEKDAARILYYWAKYKL